jgi:hypothetical protein
MAYTINKSNGELLISLPDGTLDTTLGINLVGRNYVGYGELHQENFVRLMENFADDVRPARPLVGQLWYDTSMQSLKYYNGSTFKPISNTNISSQAPTNTQIGDAWWDIANQKFRVWNGTGWSEIGPFVNTSGYTTVDDARSSLSTVPGRGDYNSETGVFTIPTDTDQLINSAGYIDINEARNALTSGTGISYDRTNGSISVNLVGGTGVTIVGDNISIGQNVDTEATPAFAGINKSGSPGVGNIGTPGNRFETVYAEVFSGTSTTAQYADVAERFHSDKKYHPGTVVRLGGPAEITAEHEEASNEVFGVISTRPAHLMNAAAGTNETHPAVAISGRVPVRVIGPIQKGQRLISAGNGLARGARHDEITALNIIGRSLEDKTSDNEGVVEAIVRLNS